MLALELGEIQDAGMDLTITGFTAADLEIENPGETDVEAVDLDDSSIADKERKVMHCPKCGFIFEVDA